MLQGEKAFHPTPKVGWVRSSGIRATVAKRKGITGNDTRCEFETLDSRDIDSVGVSGLLLKLDERIGGSRVYVKPTNIDTDDSKWSRRLIGLPM